MAPLIQELDRSCEDGRGCGDTGLAGEQASHSFHQFGPFGLASIAEIVLGLGLLIGGDQLGLRSNRTSAHHFRQRRAALAGQLIGVMQTFTGLSYQALALEVLYQAVHALSGNA